MKKVILDTDTGVDDALAIILALRSPELDVQAITTVSGNVHVDHCVRNVLRVLSLLQLPEVPPVARGCDRPLSKAPFEVPSVHGEDGLGNLDPGFYGPIREEALVQVHAVELLLNVAQHHGDEITVIATGPLTNVATAIRRDPVTMRRIREIIVMGGAVHVPGNIPPGAAEFNMFVDPHAAEIVFGFGVPITLVGLDVTHQVPLTRQCLRDRVTATSDKVAQFVIKATTLYMDFYAGDQGHNGCYLHDPLAVGVAIDRSLVSVAETRVYVETEGKVTSGMTFPFRHPTRKPWLIEPANVNVCVSVEAERFLSLFLERVVRR